MSPPKAPLAHHEGLKRYRRHRTVTLALGGASLLGIGGFTVVGMMLDAPQLMPLAILGWLGWMLLVAVNSTTKRFTCPNCGGDFEDEKLRFIRDSCSNCRLRLDGSGGTAQPQLASREENTLAPIEEVLAGARVPIRQAHLGILWRMLGAENAEADLALVQDRAIVHTSDGAHAHAIDLGAPVLSFFLGWAGIREPVAHIAYGELMPEEIPRFRGVLPPHPPLSVWVVAGTNGAAVLVRPRIERPLPAATPYRTREAVDIPTPPAPLGPALPAHPGTHDDRDARG